MTSSSRPSFRSWDFDTDMLAELLFGSEEVDFPEMVLTQNRSDNPKVFKGPGYIKRSGSGNLVFKLYSIDIPNESHRAEAWHVGSIPGKLIANDSYYTLSAIDIRGLEWFSHRILPGFNDGASKLIVQGNLRELTSAKPLEVTDTEHHIRLLFSEFIDIPCNLSTNTTISRGQSALSHGSSSANLAKFISCDLEFLLTKNPDSFVVEVTSTKPFAPHTVSRVVEALQFSLSRTLNYKVLEQFNGSSSSISIMPQQATSSNTQMPPPLRLDSLEAYTSQTAVWHMFDRYLGFVLSRTDPGWHPCSIFIHKAREASANSLDARALGISVAVEGLVNNLHKSLGEPSAELKSAVSSLKAFIKTWPGMPGWADEASLRNRIPNLLGQITSVRAADRLFALVSRGGVEHRLVESWRNLRHPMAHAELLGNEHQVYMDRILAATVLLNQVVFAAIEYEGFYTDYSTYGFPVVKYPPGSSTPRFPAF